MKETAIEVKTSLYGLEAIYKACYVFLDKVYIRLEGDPEGSVTVKIRPKEGGAQPSLQEVSGEFENELIHQALRVRVAASNKTVREYIVARALASAEGIAPSQPVNNPMAGAGGPPPQAASVLDEDLEKEIQKLLEEVEKQGGDDPLKITVPWEETKEEAKDAPKI